MLTTLVTPTVEGNTADAHTLWGFLSSLVTDSGEGVTSTSARNGDCLHARNAFALVAWLLAFVTASEHVVARLQAVRYRIFAALSVSVRNLRQTCLATRAMSNDVGRPWTMS